jgi:hypothetical protein
VKFKEYRSGLYYYDAGPNHNSTNQDYLFLNTVAGNKAIYTQREIQGADQARALYTESSDIPLNKSSTKFYRTTLYVTVPLHPTMPNGP